MGHSIGNVELDNSSGSVNQEAITDQVNPGLDKGNTNINRPNIFVANEVYFLPKLAAEQAGAVHGWQDGRSTVSSPWPKAVRSASSLVARAVPAPT